MAVKCIWASIDEHGNASGGSAGDQTAQEVKVGNWYYFNQNVVVRPKNAAVGTIIALHAEAIANNNNVGYNQAKRLTLYNAWKAVGWNNPSKIKTKCDCDCSSLAAACVNSAGIIVNPSCYSANIKNALVATGQFEALTSREYLVSSDYLKVGDIIVAEGSHVIICGGNGSKVIPTPEPRKTIYAVGEAEKPLNVYNTWKKPQRKVGDIAKGKVVYCYGTNTDYIHHPDGLDSWCWWAINPEATQWVVYTNRVKNITYKVYAKGITIEEQSILEAPKGKATGKKIKAGNEVECYGTNTVDGVVWWRIAPVTKGNQWIVYTKKIKKV